MDLKTVTLSEDKYNQGCELYRLLTTWQTESENPPKIQKLNKMKKPQKKVHMDIPTNTKKINSASLVVIDAANMAMKHGKNKKFSSLGVQLCVDYFLERGFHVVAFLPEFYLDHRPHRLLTRKAHQIPDNFTILNNLVEMGLLVLTPSQDYDDSYCIQYAMSHDGIIVSNDRFRDFIGSVEQKQWIRENTLSCTFVGNEVLPNPNFCSFHFT